ncbi:MULTISPECIES: PHP domain-containing protein [Brevibacillus]|jgi:predicted metal-dependent phosphoesterase TrpH|uniref:PHP-like protein n=1 Tax=Brevibacillus parabrevis TaxID=54914 RepID=A0A4Y3PKB3_BREPA|nr:MULTISPECIES: PHP domain-containing protein [Brevibacillus]MBU8715780.1 PHP domain-containing protein [Brevibacillus parabrevis]MDH6352727.1 putative metal-dependent phosphoesterase TrpH [Brevibacillus sp. 1238]MED2257918.1 PHP domain-containing protein [Brevibacillus parabrevis]NRQ56437.1 PHP domain-containing protein [Brevibacillus sp. HD1.4A]RNB92211.1 PHP domain-containing protein [Brevibacillus parabrevis]
MMDLHMHTTASDGKLTPAELLAEASERGVTHLAITDHDTVDGYLLARDEAERLGLKLIPGIEWNTDGPEDELHILGYGLDISDARLLHVMDRRQRERIEWIAEIVERCNRLGMAITMEECTARAKGDVLVRTDVAEVLAARGFCSTPQAAFETYLRKGCPAYVPRPSFSAREAIELTHEVGGIAILAHPGIYSFEVKLDALLAYGIDGIEVYYSKHSAQQMAFWERQAKVNHLIRSGGSDFHGHGSRNPYPVGSVPIPAEVKEWWTCCMFHRH